MVGGWRGDLTLKLVLGSTIVVVMVRDPRKRLFSAYNFHMHGECENGVGWCVGEVCIQYLTFDFNPAPGVRDKQKMRAEVKNVTDFA